MKEVGEMANYEMISVKPDTMQKIRMLKAEKQYRSYDSLICEELLNEIEGN